MLKPEQFEQVRTAAVEHFRRNVDLLKGAGAVLSETDNGWVRAEFVIGDAAVPTLRFPKKSLADDRTIGGYLRNLDAAITKAQIELVIVEAIRDLPL